MDRPTNEYDQLLQDTAPKLCRNFRFYNPENRMTAMELFFIGAEENLTCCGDLFTRFNPDGSKMTVDDMAVEMLWVLELRYNVHF